MTEKGKRPPGRETGADERTAKQPEKGEPGEFKAWEEAVRAFTDACGKKTRRLKSIAEERRFLARRVAQKSRELEDLWEIVKAGILTRLNALPDDQRQAIRSMFPDKDLVPESLMAFFYWQEQQVKPRSTLGINLDKPLRELRAFEHNPLVGQVNEAVEELDALRKSTGASDMALVKEETEIRRSFENGDWFDADTLMQSETFISNPNTAHKTRMIVYSFRVNTILAASDLYDPRFLEAERLSFATGRNAFLRVYDSIKKLGDKYGV